MLLTQKIHNSQPNILVSVIYEKKVSSIVKFRALVLLVFVIINIKMYSCGDEKLQVFKKKHTISYNTFFDIECQSVHRGNISWKIFSNDGEIVRTGTGTKIEKLLFEKPNNYFIVFTESSPKEHIVSDTSFVEIIGTRIIFNISEAKFSQPIVINKPTNGIILSIPVNTCFFNKELEKSEYEIPNITAHGAGCNITLSPLIEKIKFKSDKTILQYKLSGIATQEAYIQFNILSNTGDTQYFILKL